MQTIDFKERSWNVRSVRALTGEDWQELCANAEMASMKPEASAMCLRNSIGLVCPAAFQDSQGWTPGECSKFLNAALPASHIVQTAALLAAFGTAHSKLTSRLVGRR